MIRQGQYNTQRFSYLNNVYHRNKKLYDDLASIYKIEYKKIVNFISEGKVSADDQYLNAVFFPPKR